ASGTRGWFLENGSEFRSDPAPEKRPSKTIPQRQASSVFFRRNGIRSSRDDHGACRGGAGKHPSGLGECPCNTSESRLRIRNGRNLLSMVLACHHRYDSKH